jgi:hypothetical protein
LLLPAAAVAAASQSTHLNANAELKHAPAPLLLLSAEEPTRTLSSQPLHPITVSSTYSQPSALCLSCKSLQQLCTHLYAALKDSPAALLVDIVLPVAGQTGHHTHPGSSNSSSSSSGKSTTAIEQLDMLIMCVHCTDW